MVCKLWRYVLELGLWLCDITDKIRYNKSNMAGMWPWVTKKLLKWEKNILFHSKLILSIFLCNKVNFLTALAQSCRCCGQFDICVTICVWWLAIPLKKSGGGLTIFMMLNYFTYLTSFKLIWYSIENTQYKTITFIVWPTR